MGRLLAVGALTVVYAACFVLIEAGTANAPLLAFAGLRTAIAGFALLVFSAFNGQPLLPSRRQWPAVVVLGLTATAASYGAMFASPGRAGVGIASVLGNLQPLFIVGLAAAVLGERMGRADWAAQALGAAGAVLIAVPAAQNDTVGFSGPVLALTASLGFASGSVLAKRLRLKETLLAVTSWQLLLGSLPLLAASAFFERPQAITWDITFVAILLFLALIGTAGATAVWYRLVQDQDLGRLSTTLFLVPVAGLGLSTAIYDEPIHPLEATGVALVFIAIAVMIGRPWRALSLAMPELLSTRGDEQR